MISWSKEGRLYILESERSKEKNFDPMPPPLTGEIWFVDSNGRDKRQLTSNMYCRYVHLSPNGSKIVFSSTRNNTPSIWIMDSDGSNKKNLHKFGKFLSWNPNGTKLAYIWGNNLSVMNSDGSGERVLTENTWFPVISKESISWSNDGKKLVFRISRPDILWMVDVGTAVGKQLMEGYCPSWSPIGNEIAFLDGGDIWLVDSEGARKVRLTTTGDVRCGGFKWSPDGEKIAFSMEGLWVIDKDGSNEIQLEEGDIQSFCWSHDSKEIAFVSKSSATKPTFKGIYANILFFDKDERIIAFEDVDVDVTINIYRKVNEMEELLWSKNMTINSYKDATYLFGEGLKIPLEDVEMLKNANVAEVIVHTSKGDFVDTCSGYCLSTV